MKLFTASQLRIIKHHWNGENHIEVANLLLMDAAIVKDRLSRLPGNFLQISLDYQAGLVSEGGAGTVRIYQSSDHVYITTSDIKRIKWEKWEDDYLRDNYGIISDAMICAYINRTGAAIKERARTLGITKHYNTSKVVSKIQRPPAVYDNKNIREELLNKYAPLT